MKRVDRPILETRHQEMLNTLHQYAQSFDDDVKISKIWQKINQHHSAEMRVLRKHLAEGDSSGLCWYCCYDRAEVIDHFAPKSQFRERICDWANWIHSCYVCNRGSHKGDKYPLDDIGRPLLIDPSSQNPWDDMTFNPDIGWLGARYVNGQESPRGRTTIMILKLTEERLSRAYRRSYAGLIKQLQDLLNANSSCENDYINVVEEYDDHFLIGWGLVGDGQTEEPFKQIRERFPDIFDLLRRRFCG